MLGSPFFSHLCQSYFIFTLWSLCVRSAVCSFGVDSYPLLISSDLEVIIVFIPILCADPQELREHGEKKKRKREDAGDDDDTEGAMGVRNKVAGGKMKKRKGR